MPSCNFRVLTSLIEPGEGQALLSYAVHFATDSEFISAILHYMEPQLQYICRTLLLFYTAYNGATIFDALCNKLIDSLNHGGFIKITSKDAFTERPL